MVQRLVASGARRAPPPVNKSRRSCVEVAQGQCGRPDFERQKDMEQAMSGRQSASGAAEVGRDDVRRILGDIDEDKILEILALKPTFAELEEAAIWVSGDGDVLARSGRPLTGLVADIVDILTADEDEPPLAS